MENNKFYRVKIGNIFSNNCINETIFAIYENNCLIDILTNKKIYPLPNNRINIELFINSNSSLIGIDIYESSEEEVSIFLKFLNQSIKEKVIENIYKIEKSINDSIDIYKKNNVKILKK